MRRYLVRLLLFTGFLGAGKTTLIIKVARYSVEQGENVAILVNEIGEKGIDNQLMRRLELNVWELLNGCICCTLSSDLVSTLQQVVSGYAPSLIIIEPSGAADPRSILQALPYYRGTPFECRRTVSILDPLRLNMLLETMSPLIVSQIRHADLILISKNDQATPAELQFARQAGLEHNPAAGIADYGADTPINSLMHEIMPWQR